MSEEERDMRKRIHRMEDKLLRSKNYNEQLQIHYVLDSFRKELARIMYGKKEVKRDFISN